MYEVDEKDRVATSALGCRGSGAVSYGWVGRCGIASPPAVSHTLLVFAFRVQDCG